MSAETEETDGTEAPTVHSLLDLARTAPPNAAIVHLVEAVTLLAGPAPTDTEAADEATAGTTPTTPAGTPGQTW